MSRVLTGIYGRPSGKTGGVVWGAGRTLTGKVATTREYVIPKNPRADKQVHQRNVFTAAVGLLRTLAMDLWKYDWNNGVGELPGWQSMLSWCLKQLVWDTDHVEFLPDPGEVSLGPVYAPVIIATPTVPKKIVLTWTTEIVGDHCAAGDVVRGYCCLSSAPDTPAQIHEIPIDTIRSAATYSFTALTASTSYCVQVWFRHVEEDDSFTYSPTSTQLCLSGAAA